MTLVEFISPLKKSTHGDRVLATLYYKKHVDSEDALTVKQIKEALRSARAPNWSKVNISDVLAKSGHYVDGIQSNGARTWKLTESGDGYVRELLKLPGEKPEIVHDVNTLSQLAASLGDQEISSYVEESLTCLAAGALRASVVFLWSGAIRTIQQEMLKLDRSKMNAAIQKHDPKARKISRIDHFAYIKDRVSILAAMDLGLLDKNEKDTLIEALNLRNRSGHPGKYKPGVKKVSSFIEDLISIVFS